MTKDLVISPGTAGMIVLLCFPPSLLPAEAGKITQDPLAAVAFFFKFFRQTD
ncbi:MAG: hypothetical protein AVDCRST_MAG56-7175 [uncultured Cytophagales bacterium]|uniref:Uncharacterized protein n=1 Tax=uncultured Cytophagales bacterium TaxID=158755 RepID=A0A6J4LB49_9SPHI|nr:MAG: hypothetical protein AVDCRST_MAG56-7175 [uncultured Cytophagales bacterium]